MSRDQILKKIDDANTGRISDDPAAEAAALIANPEIFRAGFDDQDTYERFVQKATSETVTATVETLANLDALPMAISRYLEQKSLSPKIALQPRACLTALNWGDIETADTAGINEPVAVTHADAAIAETGSLVFQTAPDAPVLLNFLPLHHLAIVRRSTIFRHMEEVFDHFGTGANEQRRSLNIITGTSGTADIEAKNVRGAHGPRFMHIFCVEE